MTLLPNAFHWKMLRLISTNIEIECDDACFFGSSFFKKKMKSKLKEKSDENSSNNNVEK